MPDLLKNNDETVWDWITWETLGNPSPQFRKGDETFSFGLWRLDYQLLCKAGRNALAAEHDDQTLGRGYVKVVTVEGLDYRDHRGLIATFLPCMSINQEGSVVDPFSPERALPPQQQPLYVVFPYNYDDNTAGSRALGTRLFDLKDYGAIRLTAPLLRWSTASRSCIAKIPTQGVDIDTAYVYQNREEAWPFRPDPSRAGNAQQIQTNIMGQNAGNRRDTTYENAVQNPGAFKLYSVKTGVEYVGTQSQKQNDKDLLEANSIHAMLRSELIHWGRTYYHNRALAAKYQIEILSVLLQVGTWDGFQVRDIGDSTGQVWFPALAIPTSGKPFAAKFGKKLGANYSWWADFWTQYFAKPLGRAKAEMLIFFGLQHMTANSQNMLIAFDRGSGAFRGIILRDLGDTLLNDHFFDLLRKQHQKYSSAWYHEVNSDHGVTLTKDIGGGYKNPLMTRLGTSIVFFFGPFQTGDVRNANILSRWSIAHNHEFVAYIKDNLGYDKNWASGANTDVSDSLKQRIRRYAHYQNRDLNEYRTLVKDIKLMHPWQRWDQIEAIESELSHLDRTQLDAAKLLVDAHDMLISAEMELYVRSEVGQTAYRRFLKSQQR